MARACSVRLEGNGYSSLTETAAHACPECRMNTAPVLTGAVFVLSSRPRRCYAGSEAGGAITAGGARRRESRRTK